MTGLPLPFQLPAGEPSPEAVVFLFVAVTAVVGLFVAYQAYRGYRRNDSRPMLYLAVGVLLLTAVPAGANVVLSAATAATDAEILLVISLAHLVGVVSVLYALTRA